MRVESTELQMSAQSWLRREEIRIRQEVQVPARPQAGVDRVVIRSAEGPEISGEPQDPRLQMMLRIAEMLLGKRIRLFRSQGGGTVEVAVPREGGESEGGGGAPPTQVRVTRFRREAEQTLFHAEGRVETSDGRRIEFQASLKLSRQYAEVVSGEAEAQAGTDPLFLNFDGRGVRLQAERGQFDLNSDGAAEAVPLVEAGSGLLFADRDGDGVATDGGELFGPRTGSGFAELAEQDSDGNGWIDEGDAVFGQLRVWMQDSAGAGTVYSLAELGVGAISTGSASTPFELRGAGNLLAGELRRSGLYLMEDGRAGVVTQVDYAA